MGIHDGWRYCPPDTYGDPPRGEPTPHDDVAELRWFPKDAVPDDVELAFRWLAAGLRDWSAKH